MRVTRRRIPVPTTLNGRDQHRKLFNPSEVSSSLVGLLVPLASDRRFSPFLRPRRRPVAKIMIWVKGAGAIRFTRVAMPLTRRLRQ